MVMCICLTSCTGSTIASLDLTTWQHTRDLAVQKAKAREYNFIIEHLIATGLADRMIQKYGESNWKTEITEQMLKSLPYYFSWLKKCTVKMENDRILLTGKHGCYAIFRKVGSRYLLLDVGQKLSSM